MNTKKITGSLLAALLASSTVVNTAQADATVTAIILPMVTEMMVNDKNKAAEAPEASAERKSTLTPPEHVRREDQTLLTIPEWFLVHSPKEYANYIKAERPSRFPFFGHIRQFWSTYAAVHKATKDRYSFNFEYHAVVMTIGISTTVEYAIKGAYEAVFGALTERREPKAYRTAEDEYAAKIARDYVNFIVVDPWYKFDFMAAFNGLWDLPKEGEHRVRKWERRFALSAEYLAKSGYAWVIKKTTQASFDPPKPVTAVVARFKTKPSPQQVPGMTVLKQIDAHRYLITLPRYQAFSDSAVALARAGADFEEIAGNNEFIVLSVLTKSDFDESKMGASVVLRQPIITVPGMERVVFRVPISELSTALIKARHAGYNIEHIYDF
jgi:hypothetical protein